MPNELTNDQAIDVFCTIHKERGFAHPTMRRMLTCRDGEDGWKYIYLVNPGPIGRVKQTATALIAEIL